VSGRSSTPPPPAWDTITFDDPAVTYTLEAFGGAASAVVIDPTNAANKVGQFDKPAGAQTWAGVTVATGPNFSVPALPFTANDTTMTVRFWSPDAGTPVLLKVEDAADGGKFVEVLVNTTVAGDWETLTFDFANPTNGALNLAYTYNKVSIFPNFGNTGVEKTYYLDDVAFGGGAPPPPPAWDTITFDDPAVTYTLTGFGGADDSTVVVDPTDAANKVAKVIKSGTAELWAGTTVSTGPNFSVPALPFTASDTQMTVRVWSPDAGIQVRLKVEDAADGTKSVETEATTTVANDWETLTFDFSNQAAGTAALNLAYTYNKVSIFFNFGVTGATAGEKTYYFDDMAFGAGAPPPPSLSVGFSSNSYTVTEGETATVTVSLNMTSTNQVTVDYATADGTAVAGVDYTAISGTLTFAPGELTQSFTVGTINNDLYEGNRTLNLTLSNPVNAELGPRAQATLTILEDELSPVCEERSLMINDFEDGKLPSGKDGNGLDIGFFTWTGPGASISITTTLQVTNTVLQMDSNVPRGSWGGMTNHFTNEAVDSWVTQDWSTYAAISFWMYGTNSGETMLFEVQDNRNPGSIKDDTQIWSYSFPDNFTGWKRFVVMFDEFDMKQIGNGAPEDDFGREQVHGWAFGSTGLIGTTYLDDVQVCGTAADKPLSVAFEQAKYSANEGELAALTVKLNKPYTETVIVQYTTAEATARVGEQYTPVSGTLTFLAGTVTQTVAIPTHHDGKHTRDTRVAVNLYEGAGAPLGFQRRSVLTIVDTDPAAPSLVDDFQGAHPFIYQVGTVDLSITSIMTGNLMAVPGQGAYEDVLTVAYDGTSSFSRIFSQGQDWSDSQGLSFWYYGQNSGANVTYELRDNMAVTTAIVAPADWVLVWSDEFNGPAGTPPNRNVWKHELGDGALNEIVGWGNSEFQYYTNSTDNSAMDGAGNLVIRLDDTPADTDLVCWYGPCEYTSARLITQDQLDFEYGRIEARVQVPNGPGGLWPAFWMLGTDIPEVGWPQTGEIDIMEYVSRLPFEVFGTIHGPGYAGGASFGRTHTFTETVPSKGYLTYGVEWTPNLIIWYVDDIRYHQAIPADVAPNEWVFNHPFFLLLNAAIGGNFGGAISDQMNMPQDTLVDWVRVYQAADTAERFQASFVDNFTGWKKISIPFASFTRSANQPDGAPNDGLTLTAVNGYGFTFPGAAPTASRAVVTTHIDQVRLETEIVAPDSNLFLPFVNR
jgi:beta-glucanase (GH16 family)